MKLLLYRVIFIFLAVLPTISFSQYNVLTVDAVKIGASIKMPAIRMSYERSLGKHFSAVLSGEYGEYAYGTASNITSSSSFNTTPDETYSLSGYGIMGQARYYPFTEKKPAPLGFFIGAHFRYRGLQEKYNGPDYTGTDPTSNIPPNTPTITIRNRGSLTDCGLNLGYKFKSKSGKFVFEPLVGYGIGIVSGFAGSDRVKIDPSFVEPINEFLYVFRLQLSVGFIFPSIDLLPKAGSKPGDISY